MKNTLLIQLPIILILSLLAGAITYTYTRTEAYNSISRIIEITKPAHEEKIQTAISGMNNLEKTKEFSKNTIASIYKENESNHKLLVTTAEASKKDFNLITWALLSIIILMLILINGIYPLIKKCSNNSLKSDAKSSAL